MTVFGRREVTLCGQQDIQIANNLTGKTQFAVKAMSGTKKLQQMTNERLIHSS